MIVEIKPGISENILLKNKKILTKIIEIKDNDINLNYVIPGGLIGLMTEVIIYLKRWIKKVITIIILLVVLLEYPGKCLSII